MCANILKLLVGLNMDMLFLGTISVVVSDRKMLWMVVLSVNSKSKSLM